MLLRDISPDPPSSSWAVDRVGGVHQLIGPEELNRSREQVGVLPAAECVDVEVVELGHEVVYIETGRHAHRWREDPSEELEMHPAAVNVEWDEIAR